MKIGFCSQFVEEHIRFAAAEGFAYMELEGATAHSYLMKATDKQLEERIALLNSTDVKIAGCIHAPNFLSADKAVADAAQVEFARLLGFCKMLGAGVLATSTGRDDSLSLDDNIKKIGDVFGPMLEAARAHGVRLAFENCPGHGQLATTPYNWEKVFAVLDAPDVGLEFDPSHLVWQGVDYLAAAREFRHKIISVHAKDTQIYQDKFGRCGIYGKDWWTYRLPGYGSVDWEAFFQILREAAYDGPVMIEHEDPYFGGERYWEGLRIGKRYLSQFVW